MDKVYIGLLRHDGTEPPREAGYRRVLVTNAACGSILSGRQIVFPEVTAPGYGVIAMAASYEDEKDREPLGIQLFPNALDVHEGVVPVIHDGTLYRGMEVKAEVILNSADIFGA